MRHEACQGSEARDQRSEVRMERRSAATAPKGDRREAGSNQQRASRGTFVEFVHSVHRVNTVHRAFVAPATQPQRPLGFHTPARPIGLPVHRTGLQCFLMRNGAAHRPLAAGFARRSLTPIRVIRMPHAACAFSPAAHSSFALSSACLMPHAPFIPQPIRHSFIRHLPYLPPASCLMPHALPRPPLPLTGLQCLPVPSPPR